MLAEVANQICALRKRLEQVGLRAIENRKEVERIYLPFVSRNDARIVAFAKLVSILESTSLALRFVSENLVNPEWWQQISGRASVSENDIKYPITMFCNGFLKTGFFHSFFSAAENSLRLFLRAVDAKACNAGRAQFQAVYACLLRTKLKGRQSEGVDLLDLLCAIRTIIDSNGVYLPPSGKDKVIEWKGRRYEFKDGHRVSCADWNFIIECADDLRKVLFAVVTDPVLRKVSGEIQDPTAPA